MNKILKGNTREASPFFLIQWNDNYKVCVPFERRARLIFALGLF